MIRFLAQSILTVAGNAIGLLAAAMAVSGFRISGFGFIVSVGFFTIAQIILAPFVLKMALKYIPAFRGGIALVTTFVVLLLTIWLTEGLHIDSLTAWIIAPLVIWLTSVMAGILLPLVIFKNVLADRKSTRSTVR